MKYPFEFQEMLLTQKALDTLGFSDYWSGCGDYGTRHLTLFDETGEEPHENYSVTVFDEDYDPEGGYGIGPPSYCARHTAYIGQHGVGWYDLYFLHDLLDNIKINCSDRFYTHFVEVTKQPGVNMYPYIKSYLEFKEKQ